VNRRLVDIRRFLVDFLVGSSAAPSAMKQYMLLTHICQDRPPPAAGASHLGVLCDLCGFVPFAPENVYLTTPVAQAVLPVAKQHRLTAYATRPQANSLCHRNRLHLGK